MYSVLIGICIGLFIVSVLTTIISVVCVAIVVGFKNSTHQIEYRDINWNDGEPEKDPEDVEFNPFTDPYVSDPEKAAADKGMDFSDFKKAESAKLKEDREMKKSLIGDEDDYILKE